MGSGHSKRKKKGGITVISIGKTSEDEGYPSTAEATRPAPLERPRHHDVIQPITSRADVHSQIKTETAIEEIPGRTTGKKDETDTSKLSSDGNIGSNTPVFNADCGRGSDGKDDNDDDANNDDNGSDDSTSEDSDDVESPPVSGDEQEEEMNKKEVFPVSNTEAYSSSDERIGLACKGRLDFELPGNIKIVRIFTSSTFTDTSVERNTLMVKVYPRIKKFCQERGYEFQIVDMRWGIRDESTDDHLTSELCMKELYACQKLSTGPSFITFLGQKYGYRPFPPKIPAAEFEKLFNAVANKEDRELLERWFKRDNNSIPEEYLLQPITSVLPDYRNYGNPELRKKASGMWWAAFERMQIVFRNAAANVLDKKERLKYFMSVTEDEVRRGIITSSSPEDRCFWFKRVITNLEDNTQSQKAGSFIDKVWGGGQGTIDQEAQTFLETLREEDLPKALPPRNIKQYEVKWSSNGIDPQSSPEHAQYIDDLCKTFYDTLTGMIDKAVGKRRAVEIKDNLVEEVTDHLSFCLKKCQAFHGRREFLEEMKNALKKDRRTVVICGESGCGKTSIMAKACTLVRGWLDDDDSIVVTRFIGTSPDSSSIRPLLRSICVQLCRASDENQSAVPQDMKALVEYFPECLENAASSSPVVLILDSLDQLSPDEGARQMGWLPKELPDNVYLILSTLPGNEYECLPKLKAIVPESCIKAVPQIPLSEADDILKNWLHTASRSLNTSQSQLVMDAFDRCQIPLYLKLAFDEACRWKSYSDPSQTILLASVKGIINALFDRVEKVHGKLLVGHALGYITASKNGLTEAELEDLLSLDDEVLNDVYQYWTPPLRRLPPLLWIRIRSDIKDYLIDRGADGTRVIYWYHRQFIEVAKERYLTGGQATKIHANLSEYFLGTWAQGKKKPYVNKKGESLQDDRLVSEMPLMFDNKEPNPVFNLRMLSELPYHLICSKQLSILKERTLFNFDFLVTKMRASSLEVVLDDFTAALATFEDDNDLSELEKTLRLSAVALTTDARQLATQLIGRLLAFSKKSQEYPYISSLIKQAYSSPVACLLPSHKCLESPGGSLITSFAINEDHLHYCAFSCDDKTAYLGTTTSDGLELQVIQLQTGKIQRRMNLTDPFKMAYTWSIRGSDKDKDVLLIMGSEYIFMINAQTGKILQQFHALEDETRYHPMPPVTFADNEDRIVAITNKNLKIWTTNDGILRHTLDIGTIDTDEQYGTIDAHGNLAAFCLRGSNTIKVLDVRTANIVCEVEAFPGNQGSFVQEVKILSSEKVLALSSSLKSLSIYHLHKGNCLKEIQGFSINPGFHRLQITDNGKKAMNIVHYEVMMTDLESGEITKTLRSKSFGTLVIHTNFFTRNGRFAMSIGNDNILRLYDLKRSLEEDKEAAAKMPSNPLAQVGHVASIDRVIGLFPGVDGRHVIANATVQMSSELSVWDTETDTKVRAIKCVHTVAPQELRMCSATRGVGFMHDTNLFHYKVFNLKEGRVERCLQGKASKRTTAFGRIDDNHVIAFSQGRRNLKVWDIDTGKVVQQYKFGQTHRLEEMMISENGQMVVCAQVSNEVEHKDKTLPIIVLDTKTAQHKLLEIPQRQLNLTFSCISRDGNYLICLTNHLKPRLWNLVSGKLLHKLEDNEYPVSYAAAFSIPLQLALTAQSDGNINAWNIESGKVQHTFVCDTVDVILVSEDGNMAFSRYRYRNSNIDAWNLRNGTKLATFTSDWKPERVDIIGNTLALGMAESPDVMTLKLHVPGGGVMSAKKPSPFHGVPVEGFLQASMDSPSPDDGDEDLDDDGDKTDFQKSEFTRKALLAKPNVIIGGGSLKWKKKSREKVTATGIKQEEEPDQRVEEEEKEEEQSREEEEENEEEEKEEEEEEEEKEEEEEEEEKEEEEQEEEKEEEEEEVEEDKDNNEKDDEEEESSDDENESPGIHLTLQDYSDKLKKALVGDLDIEFPENVKVVRIFTSSTFTDTSVERNTLMIKVFPRIKKFCQERGYEFQIVDMRWGIRDESTDDHLTSELCMKELYACQKLSTGPSFITFLGQKYGYRPFPPKISAAEFEKLLSAVDEQDDIDLLKLWFLRNDNSVPPEYVLQPISSVLPNYRNYDKPELRKEASGIWWAAFERIQVLFRMAADKVLTKKHDRLKYFMSVTEDEVRRGIINAKDPLKHTFWFKRVISDLKKHVSDSKVGQFMDKTWATPAGEVDKEAQDYLNTLREKDLPAVLPKSNIVQYNVQWNKNGIDPQTSSEHAQYIDKLTNDVYEKMTTMISDGIAENETADTREAVAEEIFQHLSFCQKKCQAFFGRGDFLELIKTRLLNKDNRAVVLYGESGCGKTSLMAKVTTAVKSWFEDEMVVVVCRFIGTSPASSSIRVLLRNVCQQLCKISGNTADIPEDMKSLTEFFPECLEKAAEKLDKVVLVLDSLDQLSVDDSGRLLDWLPRNLPYNVYIVLSTLPGEEYQCLPSLRLKYPEESLVEVPQLPLDEAGLILDNWHQGAKKTLQSKQRKEVMDSFQECPLPLYLKLAFDESCRWKSYTPFKEWDLPPNVTDIISGLFERVEKVHGKLLVGHALGYITASKNGLTEAELEDLLSLDDEVLNDVYQYWTPPLRRLPPLLWIRIRSDIKDYLIDRGADGTRVIYWYHRQFIEVAKERYLTGGQATKIHANLSEYFLGTWAQGKKKPYVNRKGESLQDDRLVSDQPMLFGTSDENPIYNLRKLSELPYHLFHAKQYDKMKDEVLCNFEFLLAKLRGTSVANVLEDFSLYLSVLPGDPDVKIMQECLRLSLHPLSIEPKQFSTQLLGRMFKFRDRKEKYPYVCKILEQAQNASAPCFIPNNKFLTAPGGALVSTITLGNYGQDYISIANDNQTIAVTCVTGEGLEIKIINIQTGEQLRKFTVTTPSSMYRVTKNVISEKDINLLLLAGGNVIFLLNTQTGQIVKEFKVDDDDWFSHKQKPPVAYAEDETLLVALARNTLRVWQVSDCKVIKDIPIKDVDVDDELGLLAARGKYVVYNLKGKKTIHFVDIKQGKEVAKVTVNYKEIDGSSPIKDLKVTSKDQVIVVPSSQEDHLRIYDLHTANLVREVTTFKMTQGMDQIQITDDGTKVLSIDMYEIRTTDLETGESDTCLRSAIFRMKIFTRDGSTILTIGQDFLLRVFDRSREGDDENKADTTVTEYEGHKIADQVTMAQPCFDNRHVVAITYVQLTNRMSVWDTLTGQKIREMKGSQVYPTAIRLSQDSTRVVGLIHDEKLPHYKVINLKEGVVERNLEGGACKRINAYGMIDNHRMISFSRNRKNLKIWDIITGKVVDLIKLGKAKHLFEEMLISPDGKIVVISFTNMSDTYPENTTRPLYVYNTVTKQQKVLTMEKIALSLYIAAISDDGKYLITFEQYSKPYLWNLETGQMMYKLLKPDSYDTASTAAINTRVNIAVTGVGQGGIDVWDISKGTLLRHIDCTAVTSIFLSVDGDIVFARDQQANTINTVCQLRPKDYEPYF
ncbi:hypothetical protein QZH41_017906 [Actinostola sp. cb2023]|nr:hypothetical protein QZH41_017906 [Actinostola sp. cb2023]